MPSKRSKKGSKKSKRSKRSKSSGSKFQLMKKCRKLKIKCGGLTVAEMRAAIRAKGGVKRGRRPSSKSSGSRSALSKKMKKLGLSYKSKTVAQMRSAIKKHKKEHKEHEDSGYQKLSPSKSARKSASRSSPKKSSPKKSKGNRWIQYVKNHSKSYKAKHPRAKQTTVMKALAREYKKQKKSGSLSPARTPVSKPKVKKAKGRKPSSKKKGSKHQLRLKYKKLYGELPPNYMVIADLKKAIKLHSNSSGDLSLDDFDGSEISELMKSPRKSHRKSYAKVASRKRSPSPKRSSRKSPSPMRSSSSPLLKRTSPRRSRTPKGRVQELSTEEELSQSP